MFVYDSIIDDERRENAFGLLMSLNMLIETPGGFDHAGAESLGWLLERLEARPRWSWASNKLSDVLIEKRRHFRDVLLLDRGRHDWTGPPSYSQQAEPGLPLARASWIGGQGASP